ncbi:MAG: hypothetical protein KH620_00860 [Collinsella sp.]|nr:hypothetical protein [Collinsella sp.]
MDRRAISVTLAVVCLTVLLGATGLFAISRETSYMQECASEGFAIDGYYRDDKTSREILAFLEEDGCRWQLVDKDGSCVDGQFKRTDDPNILILKKENGEEFGPILSCEHRSSVYGGVWRCRCGRLIHGNKTASGART